LHQRRLNRHLANDHLTLSFAHNVYCVCCTDREMLVIITYLNNNAQTPLNRFVVYVLYSQLCNKIQWQIDRRLRLLLHV